MMKLFNLFTSSMLCLAPALHAADSIECDVTDRSLPPPPPPGARADGSNKPPLPPLIAAKEAGAPKAEARGKENSPEPNPKLKVSANSSVNFNLKDNRFYVQVAHYTGTYQILLFDRSRRIWTVKATSPEQNFSGLLLESIKPAVKVDCAAIEAPPINLPAKE